MTKANSTIVAASPAFKGKDAIERAAAFAQIAPLSFAETISRDATIDNLRRTLGAKPSAAHLDAARTQWIVGRVAARLAISDLGASVADTCAHRLDFALSLVTRYAAPPKDGVKARPIRKGQLGRRTITQHKCVRAAVEAWSQVLAELGAGKAQTQAKRNANKAKRAASNPAGKTPTHAQLVAAPKKAANADDACGYLESMSATMLAFANKNAGYLPTDYGMAVKAFKRAVDAAAKARAAK